MWVLGIDTSTASATVALTFDREIKAVYSINSTLEHSTALLPIIEDILQKSSVKIKDLNLICCSNGPGSFTGIRIGISTAKGLAYSNDIPCVGVSSLEAAAYLFTEMQGFICPVINARNSNVYSAVFESDGNGNIIRISEDEIIAVSEIEKRLDHSSAYFVGDAYDLVTSSLSREKIKKTPMLLRKHNAYGVILAGYQKFMSVNDELKFSHKNLKPVYLRKTLAERQKMNNEQ